jgi:hypothetical protein
MLMDCGRRDRWYLELDERKAVVRALSRRAGEGNLERATKRAGYAGKEREAKRKERKERE